MTRVVTIAFDGVQTLDLTGPAEVFACASRCRGAELYRVEVASRGGGERITSSGMTVVTRDLASIRIRSDDIVMVSGGEEPAIRAAIADTMLLQWLVAASRRARIVSSVCSGAFLLAAAGLLDGRRASTHWSACDKLARAFPRVEVDASAIFIRDGAVWTSAGVTTGIDMALAMVERDHDRRLADAIAAQLVLYVRRPGYQSQFSDTLIAQSAGADGLDAAVLWARSHLADADVETLARRAKMSVRTLHRRCREALGTTPARLVDKLRVEHAKALLLSREVLSKELAVLSGFGTIANLNRAFTRELGMAPRAFRVLHGRQGSTARAS